jgi:hypothetical protein
LHQRDNAPLVDENGKKYESNRVNNMAHKPDAQGAESVREDAHVGAIINLSPIPSFELVSIYDPDPAQSRSQATTDDAIKYLYTKLMTDAVNKKKKN